MNGEIEPHGSANGFVTQLQLSGFGPNSGEITLGITQDDGSFIQVFGGIISQTPTENGLEDGVFAAFVNLATIAYVHKRRVQCTYVSKDKLRFYQLSLLD